MSAKKIQSYCRDCGQNMNHRMLVQHIESGRDEYSYDRTYQVIECLECETKSFRDIFEDIEHAYQISDDEWKIPNSITVYPRFIEDHQPLNGRHHLPSLVNSIYKEVLLAIREEAFILAGLGLRGTVEAVCNDLKVTDRNLDKRISKLVIAGYISSRDAGRLHGIRFMGNDAAHEIKKPEKKQLSVALKIVETLLTSVYILEQEAHGKIDTLITEFDPFWDLLKNKIKLFSAGDELSIKKIFGRDFRRVRNSVTTLETELISRINSGDVTNLAIGIVDQSQDSQLRLQNFKIL